MQIALEIEQHEETVSGRFAVEGTPPGQFFGWLELLDLLHRASTGEALECPSNDSRTEPGR